MMVCGTENVIFGWQQIQWELPLTDPPGDNPASGREKKYPDPRIGYNSVIDFIKKENTPCK
jgi:hypothetical protein